MPKIKSLLDFVSAHKRRLATAAFALGFLVDIITFRNINLDLSQILLAGYLTILAGSILILAAQTEAKKTGVMRHVHAWLPIVQQYAAGNLLSAFLVLYFSSGSFSASWPFLLLVAFAAIGNERFSLERYRLPFQTTLFFLNLMLFFALATPIALRSLGFFTFLSSIAISLAVFVSFFLIGSFVARRAFRENARRIGAGALSVGALILTLYATHLIPPIPLSAKSIDFYHSVAKVGDAYVAIDEERSWFERFLDIGGVRLRLAAGEPAYVYTSIFAPARLGTDVVHRWESFDKTTGDWVTRDVVRFPILGGRAEGYRGYSLAPSPTPGRWRVSVETSEGAVIGRMYFMVERVPAPVATVTRVLD